MPALSPKLADAAADVLGRAFAADPAFRFALPDDSRRARQLTWLASRLIRLAWFAGGHVDAVDERPSAVALWVPVERAWREPLWPVLRAGLIAAPFVFGLASVRRLMAMDEVTKSMHRARAPLPHDYLMQLAVDPQRQGAGLGGALLEEGLRRAAAAGRAVWLETTNLRNVPFYERHGLVEIERRTLPGDVVLVGMSSRSGS